MREEECSFLDVFRDPLLTIIALALMSTVWIVIPSGSVEPSSENNALKMEDEIYRLKKEIDLLKKTIDNYMSKIEILREELYLKEKQLKKSGKITKLIQQIDRLKRLINSKNIELNRLKKELEAATAESKKSLRIHKSIEEIRRIKESIRDKEVQLKILEEKIKSLKRKQTKRVERSNEEQNIIRSTQRQIELKEQELEKYHYELNKIMKLAQGLGFGEYTESKIKDKKPVYFQAIDNRVILIDKDNYDIETHYTMENGQVVVYGRLTKKGSVKGDSITDIVSSISDFQKKLNKCNPSKDYLVFMVNKYSYDVFRKARAIAFQKKFHVGWWPKEGPIYTSSSGGTKVRAR